MTDEERDQAEQAFREQSSNLIRRARESMRLDPVTFADHFGVSRRTVYRWEGNTTPVLPDVLNQAALLIAAIDPPLARELDAMARKRCAELGLPGALKSFPAEVRAPQLAQRPEPSPPLPAIAVTETRHLVDSVVCAATDTGEVPTHAVRAMLLAAFTRAEALKLDVATVRRGLEPEVPYEK